MRAGGRLPRRASTRRALVALGLLGGIGLTVSLFIAGLSFSGPDLDAAKLAILGGAPTLAAVARRRRTPDDPTGSGRRRVTSAATGESEQAP